MAPRGSFNSSALNSSSISLGPDQDADPDNLFNKAEESIWARHEQDVKFARTLFKLEVPASDDIAAALKEEINLLKTENASLRNENTYLRNENTSLKNENATLNNDMECQKKQLSELKNEQQDSDIFTELTIVKQKWIEKYLRRTVEEAWDQIAKLEGGNKDSLERKSERISSLDKRLQIIKEKTSGKDLEIQYNNMKTCLQEAELKYQNAMKDLHTKDGKIKQLQKLVCCKAKLHAKIIDIEHLEAQVLELE